MLLFAPALVPPLFLSVQLQAQATSKGIDPALPTIHHRTTQRISTMYRQTGMMVIVHLTSEKLIAPYNQLLRSPSDGQQPIETSQLDASHLSPADLTRVQERARKWFEDYAAKTPAQ
ncbi:MAG: hypothetical protein ACYC46_02040 [Acidobacteriaceae bacterium]